MSLSVTCDLVSGDRLPADAWRVSLELNHEEIMFREWSCGIHGEHTAEAKRAAYAFADRLRGALEQ